MKKRNLALIIHKKEQNFTICKTTIKIQILTILRICFDKRKFARVAHFHGCFAKCDSDFYNSRNAILSYQRQGGEQVFKRYTKTYGINDNGYLSLLWFKGCEI